MVYKYTFISGKKRGFSYLFSWFKCVPMIIFIEERITKLFLNINRNPKTSLYMTLC